jgi:hypothetical protein
MCDVRLICNHLYSPLLGTDQHNVTNRDVTRNNYNTLTVVFTGPCLVAASRFLFFRAMSKVQCKVPTPDWRQTDTDDWLLVTFLVHSRYIASEQTAKKTQLPTICLLLSTYLLPRNAFTELLCSNGCLFRFHCWGFQHSANIPAPKRHLAFSKIITSSTNETSWSQVMPNTRMWHTEKKLTNC